MRKAMLLGALAAALLLTSCGTRMPETPPEELDTPQYPAVQTGILVQPDVEEIHTAEEGVKLISPETMAEEANPLSGQTPETVWKEDHTATYHAFTLPDQALLNTEGCIGVLSIPALSLEMNVYETDDMLSTMLKGAAHFKSTSAWDGNIGISAHNGGVPTAISFGRLKELKIGDTVFYKTNLGNREYQVETIQEIRDDDWSWLSRTSDNRLTLLTCVNGQPEKRLMVQAKEVR